MKTKNTQKYEVIDYQELARRVGDCVLNNQVKIAIDENGQDWELINGEESYCYVHENKEDCEKDDYNTCEQNFIDIYQEYIITKSGADYLKSRTNEIVYYNKDLDMYLWGITHFGTLWNGVHTTIKA